jgi:hypothetical protein
MVTSYADRVTDLDYGLMRFPQGKSNIGIETLLKLTSVGRVLM